LTARRAIWSIRNSSPGVRGCSNHQLRPGGLIVEADLKAALANGHVAGVGLDVFAEEPAAQPAVRNGHVVCTPHLGASTMEAQENVAQQLARR